MPTAASVFGDVIIILKKIMTTHIWTLSLMERKIVVACFIEHVNMCFADALKDCPNFNLV